MLLNCLMTATKYVSLFDSSCQFNYLVFMLQRQYLSVIYQDKCEWGWKDSLKRDELFDEDACYLIARDSAGILVAFSHFRFDLDYGRPVLYCYELQLTEGTRRKGLGRRMMQTLELLAWRAEMECVVLTVLKHNHEACAFFHAMKYELDETSPEDSYDETHCYEILSKHRKKTAT
ncbi:hypothetical protein B566_EDAN016790 [Ephemera danica]|nr:hypothetical protein B566_EDAN016790 [Ephemera danica]